MKDRLQQPNMAGPEKKTLIPAAWDSDNQDSAGFDSSATDTWTKTTATGVCLNEDRHVSASEVFTTLNLGRVQRKCHFIIGQVRKAASDMTHRGTRTEENKRGRASLTDRIIFFSRSLLRHTQARGEAGLVSKAGGDGYSYWSRQTVSLSGTVAEHFGRGGEGKHQVGDGRWK